MTDLEHNLGLGQERIDDYELDNRKEIASKEDESFGSSQKLETQEQLQSPLPSENLAQKKDTLILESLNDQSSDEIAEKLDEVNPASEKPSDKVYSSDINPNLQSETERQVIEQEQDMLLDALNVVESEAEESSINDFSEGLISDQLNENEYSESNNITGDSDEEPQQEEKSNKKDFYRGDINTEYGTVNAENFQHIVNVNAQKSETYLESYMVPPTIRNKIKSVYVAGDDYYSLQVKLKNNLGKRIVVIRGESFSGKYATAVHLGLSLRKDSTQSLNNLKILDEQRISLLEIIKSQTFKKDGIYIVEDAFARYFSLTDLTEQYLIEINRLLEKKTAYFLLLSTLPSEHFSTKKIDWLDLSSSKHYEKEPSKNQPIFVNSYLEKVFEKHIAYYQENQTGIILDAKLGEDALQYWSKDELYNYLSTPSIIDLFCYNLSIGATYEILSSPENRVKYIKEVAQKASRTTRESPIVWFLNLRRDDKFENYRLYALLAGIFEDISLNQLNEIYQTSVNWLRNEGLVDIYADPRQFSMDELLSAIQIDAQDSNKVQFRVKGYIEETWRQLPNYHHLLWSIIDRLVKEQKGTLSSQPPEFRRALGIAIGRLGIYHHQKLSPILNQLAEDKEAKVRVVSAYALEGMCLAGVEHYALALDFLKQWLNSYRPYKLWTVAASMERVYPVISDEADSNSGDSFVARESLETLEVVFSHLAGNFNHAKISGHLSEEGEANTEQFHSLIVGSVVHAAISLSWNYSSNLVRLILGWVNQVDFEKTIRSEQDQENLNRLIVTSIISQRLFSIHDGSAPLSKEQHEPFLELVQPVLALGDMEAGSEMMISIREWVKYEHWNDYVLAALIKTVNRCKATLRNRLIFLLQEYWLESNVVPAQSIARKIISRGILLNGAPSVPSGILRGIIAIDTGFGTEAHKITRIGRRLFYVLNSQIDTSIVRLGRHNSVVSMENMVKADDLYTYSTSLPLLAPVIRFCEKDPQSIGLVMVFSQKEIIDLTDLDSYVIAQDETQLSSSESHISWPNQTIFVDLGEKKYGFTIEVIGSHYEKDKELKLGFYELQEFHQTDLSWTAKLFHLPPEELQYITRPPLEYSIYQSIGNRLQDNSILDLIIKKLEEKSEVMKLEQGSNTIELLNLFAKTIDEIDSTSEISDVFRFINGGIVVLAEKDFELCVSFVYDWLESENELEKIVGLAVAKLLFILFMNRSVPVNPYICIFKLSPALAKHNDWEGIKHVLWLIRNWIRYPHWRSRFNYFNGKLSYVLSMIDLIDKSHHKKVIDILNQSWKNPIRSVGEKSLPEGVDWIATYLANRLFYGGYRPLPDFGGAARVGLIILDLDFHHEANQTHQRYLQTLDLIISKIQKHKDSARDEIQLVIFQIGRANPIFISGDAKVKIFNDNKCRIAYPILNYFKPKSLVFTLLFSNQLSPPIDYEDWKLSWRPHIDIFTIIKSKTLIKRKSWIREFPNLSWEEEAVNQYISEKIKGI